MNKNLLASSRLWLVTYHRQLLLVLLCIGLFYSLGQHTVRLYDDLTAIAPEKTRPAGTPQKKVLAAADFQLLFGRADDQPKVTRTADIPATKLNLTLRGALAGAEPSSAIIQGNDGQDHLYRIGDSIAGGVTLDSVHPHYVVINHNGTLQKLLFPEIKAQPVEAYTPPPPSARGNLPAGPVSEAEQARNLEQQMERLRQRIEGAESGQGN